MEHFQDIGVWIRISGWKMYLYACASVVFFCWRRHVYATLPTDKVSKSDLSLLCWHGNYIFSCAKLPLQIIMHGSTVSEHLWTYLKSLQHIREPHPLAVQLKVGDTALKAGAAWHEAVLDGPADLLHYNSADVQPKNCGLSLWPSISSLTLWIRPW